MTSNVRPSAASAGSPPITIWNAWGAEAAASTVGSVVIVGNLGQDRGDSGSMIRASPLKPAEVDRRTWMCDGPPDDPPGS